MYVPLCIAAFSDPVWQAPALPPQLVLDRAPTAQELYLKRRELLRARRMPRDGRLVCTIPIEFEYEVKCLPWHVFLPVSMYGKGAYDARVEGEIGQMIGWTIVVCAHPSQLYAGQRGCTDCGKAFE